MSNAVNLIDGMDGLAAGVSAISALDYLDSGYGRKVLVVLMRLDSGGACWCLAWFFALEF